MSPAEGAATDPPEGMPPVALPDPNSPRPTAAGGVPGPTGPGGVTEPGGPGGVVEPAAADGVPGPAAAGGDGVAQPTVTSLRAHLGKQVVSKATAESLGSLRGVVVDVATHAIVAWQVNSGRKARLVDHSAVSGLGDAALIVEHEQRLREAATPEEVATVKGRRVLLGAKVLSDAGNILGEVTDAGIDPVSARIVLLQIGDETFDAARLRGFGSFALVLAGG